MVQETRTPAYCTVCGTRLEEDSLTTTLGFDAYTGERLTSDHRSLDCPNPTVVVTGFGPFKTRSETSHPSWSFNDGAWSQN